MAEQTQYGFFRDVQLDEFGKLNINADGTIGELTSIVN